MGYFAFERYAMFLAALLLLIAGRYLLALLMGVVSLLFWLKWYFAKSDEQQQKLEE